MVPFVIPFVAIQHLKAMRLWVKWQQRMSLEIDHDELTLEDLDLMEACWVYEQDLSTDQHEPTTPVLLKDASQWRKFWEAFKGTCMAEQGKMKLPLAYVYRHHTEVDDDIRNKEYDDEDARLSACVIL